MINLSTVTKAVEALFKDAPTLKTYTVVRGKYINDDPGISKWIGIYKGSIKSRPKTIGRGVAGFKSEMTIKIIVQAYGVVHTIDIDSLLDERIDLVTDVIDENKNLGGTVDSVVGYDVEYRYSEGDDITMAFQLAIITISMEKRA